MPALGFDDIAFDGNKLDKTPGTPSTGTIKGAGIENGHFLFVLKGKKKIWFGKTISPPDGGGRLQFRVYPVAYSLSKDEDFADDTVTVTVVNPTLPPSTSGPNEAVPQPDIP